MMAIGWMVCWAVATAGWTRLLRAVWRACAVRDGACLPAAPMQKAGARPAFRRSVNRRPARQLVTLSPDGRTMAVEPTGTRL